MVRSVSCASKLSTGVTSYPKSFFHQSFVRTSLRNLRGRLRFRVISTDEGLRNSLLRPMKVSEREQPEGNDQGLMKVSKISPLSQAITRFLALFRSVRAHEFLETGLVSAAKVSAPGEHTSCAILNLTCWVVVQIHQLCSGKDPGLTKLVRPNTLY